MPHGIAMTVVVATVRPDRSILHDRATGRIRPSFGDMVLRVGPYLRRAQSADVIEGEAP